MKKTIYSVYVPMESQEQCDRMKKLCLDNELTIWKRKDSFLFDSEYGNQFYCTLDPDAEGEINSFVILFSSEHTTKVTESEFIDLLKKHKL